MESAKESILSYARKSFTGHERSGEIKPDMGKKKGNVFTKQTLTLVGIIVSVIICALCVASDVTGLFTKADIDVKGIEDRITGLIETSKDVIQDISAVSKTLEAAVAENPESEANEEPAKELDKGTVVRVKDGDTYVLNINGEETTVRLIGVDTPESVAPENYSKENTEEGKEISNIVKEKIRKGDTLYVEYDISKTDKYGRTLAYLYFEDGTMVQEWLLENGYAQCVTIQPNSKYANRFAEIQHNAVENGIGLWAYFCETDK